MRLRIQQVFTLVVWLSLALTAIVYGSPSEKTLTDLAELVQQLRGAIMARDVSGVKMYLAELEGLGRLSASEAAKPCIPIDQASSQQQSGEESAVGSGGSSHRLKKKSSSSSKREEQLCQLEVQKCKNDLQKSNSLVESSRKHQSQEVEKLKQVRKGVEQLLLSLKGAQNNLNEIRRESSEREVELSTLQKQAAAAAQLERDISEIQERAKINYETGMVELEGGRQLSSSISGEVMNRHKIALVDAAIMHADPKLLLDVVVLLGAATAGGTLASAMSMPHIIGYLLGGAVIGPSGWGIVKAVVQVETLAQFGGVFFLFGHGLEFSLKEQRKFQTVSVGGALLSAALISVTVQISALVTGVVSSPLEGALLGMSVSLSSLSVVLEYLHAHNLLQSTPAKVMVGMLGVQGFMVGLFFSVPPALSVESPGLVVSKDQTLTKAPVAEKQATDIAFSLFMSFLYALFTSGLAFAATRHVLPRVFASAFITGDQELYLLVVVSLAMFMALMTESFGLSLDLGAFLAGLMLSELDDGSHRTKKVIQPLSSVFGAMLFASLGMMLNAEFFWRNLGEILAIAIQLVAVKAIIVWCVVRLFDFSFRTSIFCAVGLSHVGELSLLFSSKLQAYNLLSRRAYLLFLAATFATLAMAPLVLRLLAKSRLATVDRQHRAFSLDKTGPDALGDESPMVGAHSFGPYGDLGSDEGGKKDDSGRGAVSEGNFSAGGGIAGTWRRRL